MTRITATTFSQGTRTMRADHGGNVAPAATGTLLGKCPDCGHNFYKPTEPYGMDAMKCSGCGFDFIMHLITRNAA